MCAINTEVSDYLNSVRDSSGNIPAEEEAFLKGYLELKCMDAEILFERYEELDEKLKLDPMALIRDCAEQNGLDTQAYIDLYEHEIPQNCSDRLRNLGQGYENQPIEQGNVPMANIDYYGVTIISPPLDPTTNQPLSNDEIFSRFRQNFVNFASGSYDDFQFETDVPFDLDDKVDISWNFTPLTNNDASMFLTNNTSSIYLIRATASGLSQIPADNGAVIVSENIQNSHWTVSTIKTPTTGTQPFSGNRQWGMFVNDQGYLEIYTRAVDVARSNWIVDLFSNDSDDIENTQKDYYNIADVTWRNLQNEVQDWIRNSGGQTGISANTVQVKWDRDKISNKLKSTDSIDELLCR